MLNTLPHYVTEIDGQTIHFVHRCCADPDALALVLTHGWPGSIVEFLNVIEPLSEHFHLVIPSIPGSASPAPPVSAAGPRIASPARGRDTITHWSEFDRGGHFATREVPDLLVENVRTFSGR